MGEFGFELREQTSAEYSEHYIKYDELMSLFLDSSHEYAELPPIIYDALDEQLRACYMLFREKLDQIKDKSVVLIGKSPNLSNTDDAYNLASYIIRLVNYLDVNLRIISDILDELNNSLKLPSLKANYLYTRLKREGSTLKNMIDTAQLQEVLAQLQAFIKRFKPSKTQHMKSPLLEDPLSYKLTVTTCQVKIAETEFLKILAENPVINYKHIPHEQDYPSLSTLILTIMSSFLYMMNIYLLLVPSKKYVEQFTGNAAYSGYLSGLTYLTAGVLAFPYSIWSNFQFKTPTIVFGLFAILGNSLYFLAHTVDSVVFLILARVLLGVAYPRVVHRRYILAYVSANVRSK